MPACPYCGAINSLRSDGLSPYSKKQRYLCTVCNRKWTKGAKLRAKPGENTIITQCQFCGTETTNAKFCSLSCSTKHKNRISPYKSKTGKPGKGHCQRCGEKVDGYKRVCEACKIKIDWSTRTIADIHSAAKYQVSSQLRTMARQQFAKSQRPRVCQNCGYDKHVEICHIRAIQDFTPDTPVSIVSGIDNLVALCPNCHWEFDHGVLHIEDIPPLVIIRP